MGDALVIRGVKKTAIYCMLATWYAPAHGLRMQILCTCMAFYEPGHSKSATYCTLLLDIYSALFAICFICNALVSNSSSFVQGDLIVSIVEAREEKHGAGIVNRNKQTTCASCG